MGLLEIARLFRGVREVPENRGLRVEAIQHWSGGTFGDSWCCEMWWMWLDLFFSCAPTVPRLERVQDVLDLATRQQWLVTEPQPGDSYIFVNAAGQGHHIGVLTGTDPLTGIAGNTSADGTSVDGTGVFEHALLVDPALIRYVRIPGVVP